jgi:hypothetical protein
MEQPTLDLKIPNNFNKLYARFIAIMERGMQAGMKKVSPEILDLSLRATGRLSAYMKCAKLADDMYRAGLPVKQVPEEIDNQTNEVLDKLDVQMTLDISML